LRLSCLVRKHRSSRTRQGDIFRQVKLGLVCGMIENAAERPDMPHQLFYNATAALPASTCCYIFVLVFMSLPWSNSQSQQHPTDPTRLDSSIDPSLTIRRPSIPSPKEAPPCVLDDLLLLLLPLIRDRGSRPLSRLALLARQLLGLLVRGPSDGPVELAEDAGFDCWSLVRHATHPQHPVTYRLRSTGTESVHAWASRTPSTCSAM
jgi:hypothetical protein